MEIIKRHSWLLIFVLLTGVFSVEKSVGAEHRFEQIFIGNGITCLLQEDNSAKVSENKSESSSQHLEAAFIESSEENLKDPESHPAGDDRFLLSAHRSYLHDSYLQKTIVPFRKSGRIYYAFARKYLVNRILRI